MTSTFYRTFYKDLTGNIYLLLHGRSCSIPIQTLIRNYVYLQVLQRHLDTNCEMMKRITSPGADSTNQTLSLDDPPSDQPITQVISMKGLCLYWV